MQKEACNDEQESDKQFCVRLPSCHETDHQKDGADNYQRQSPILS